MIFPRLLPRTLAWLLTWSHPRGAGGHCDIRHWSRLRRLRHHRSSPLRPLCRGALVRLLWGARGGAKDGRSGSRRASAAARPCSGRTRRRSPILGRPLLHDHQGDHLMGRRRTPLGAGQGSGGGGAPVARAGYAGRCGHGRIGRRVAAEPGRDSRGPFARTDAL